MLFFLRLFTIFLCFFLSFALSGCNSSDKDPICTIGSEQALSCNGGYSYWINPLYGISEDVLAITGVKKNRGSSQQWLTFLSSDLSTIIVEHRFSNQFKADEHNAPAVIALSEGRWLAARTGHNDLSVDLRGIIEVTLFNNDLTVSKSVTLETDAGSTYSQLAIAEGKVYLLTRDKFKGWGVFVSNDEGATWSDWEIINQTSGRKYALMKTENRSDQAFERIILNTANHPLEPYQNIAYSYMDLTIDDPLKVISGDIAIGKDVASISFKSQFQVSSDLNSNIRLLDVYNDNDSICHLYSSQNDLEDDDKWQLKLITKNVNSESSATYSVGSFNGVLGNNAYITGASIKSCHYVDGDSIDVLVTSNIEQTSQSSLSLITLDAQTGNVLSENVLYSSDKKLYRPIFIKGLNYVMFNEAEYWNTYEDWLANQKIIKL
jgi:hypothetical protein